MLDKKGYLDCSLNHEGFKKYDASKRPGPISDCCIEGNTCAGLSGSKLYSRLHDVLNSPSFNVMAYKGYFMVWGIVEFKDFRDSFY